MAKRAIRTPEAGLTLVVAALFSGVALLAALRFAVSLGATLALSACLAAAGTAVVLRMLAPEARREFAARALAGFAGGICGVALYDAVRVTVVQVLHLAFNPFGALPIFGTLLTGAGAHTLLAQCAGFAYHYLNGVMFGVSYGIALGRAHWAYGIAWALGLEALQLAVYPGFLDLRATRSEFTLLSTIGHLAYGSGLGLATTRILRTRLPRSVA